MEELTRQMEAIPFDHDAALAYGSIRAALERKGQIIGSNDLLIAAQAISRDLVVVTGNTREFSRVPDLRYEKLDDMTRIRCASA